MKILVPFDLRTGPVTLRTVIEEFQDENVELYAVHFSDTPNESTNNVIKRQVSELADRVSKSGDCEILEEIVIRGVENETSKYIGPAISGYAKEIDADLVIMSDEKKSLFSRVFRNSNKSYVRESASYEVEVLEP